MQRGVVILDCTQCLEGAVNLAKYTAGSTLARAGVIGAFDRTAAEAALVRWTKSESSNRR
jgi:L-asparaginase